MRMQFPIMVALVGLAATSPNRMAGQDIAGRWDVKWAQAIRVNRDESVEIQKWGTGLLVLRQDGGQLSGEWTTTVLSRVTWKVEGSLAGGRLTLRATEHDSDEPQLAQVQEMRWRGTLNGDRLEGEMTILFRGAQRALAWRPWRAVRHGPG